MKGRHDRPQPAADLRRRAEEIVRKKAAPSPQDLTGLSPEEARRTLHELQVHQIELEMQNEVLREAQAELDAARARYFELYDLAPVGYVTLSEKDLILETNLTAATLLGVSRDTLVKQPISRFILREDQDVHYLHRMQRVENAEPQSYELRMLRQDGTHFWAHLQAVIARDGDAAAVRRVAISDITKRKQAEAALRENEQRLGLFIDHAPAALAMLDRDMRYVSASRRWMSDYGLGERNLRGLSHYEIFPEIPERWRAVHRRALTGEVLRADMDRFDRADGSVQWIRWEVRPWHDPEGNIGGVVIFSEDLSVIKHGEEALRQTLLAKQAAEHSSAAKTAFLANMSHELRTPLNAILGFSRLMRNAKDASAEQIQNLDIINRSGEYLLNLINNVLDVSRIESGRLELKEIHFDLHQLLHGVRSLMHARALDKRLTLVSEYPLTLPRQVCADEAKLRQVLINLVDNAIKFAEQGNVILRAGLLRQESQHAWVRFEVEDSGPGISEEDHKRIFFPFVQLGDHSPTESGAGLGLSISKQYVELMGGRIGATSALGKGAVFHFEIPMRLSSPSEAIPANSQQGRVARLAPGQKHYRLLIAEDQPENRLLLRKLLEPLGFELREAADGEEAMALFGEWRPHLIWMDIGMPKVDGLQAIRQIRASAAGADTKIVAVTAHVFEDERNRILAAGCDDFIRKPYGDAEIFEALAKHLGVRFLYREDQAPAHAVEAGELDAAQLAKLPAALLGELREAAVLLDGGRCLEVAGRIARIDDKLGARLRDMVKNLQFKELLGLLDSFMAGTAA